MWNRETWQIRRLTRLWYTHDGQYSRQWEQLLPIVKLQTKNKWLMSCYSGNKPTSMYDRISLCNSTIFSVPFWMEKKNFRKNVMVGFLFHLWIMNSSFIKKHLFTHSFPFIHLWHSKNYGYDHTNDTAQESLPAPHPVFVPDASWKLPINCNRENHRY